MNDRPIASDGAKQLLFHPAFGKAAAEALQHGGTFQPKDALKLLLGLPLGAGLFVRVGGGKSRQPLRNI